MVLPKKTNQLRIFVLIGNQQQLSKHHFYSLEYPKWWSLIKRMYTFFTERNFISKHKKRFKEEKQEQVSTGKRIVFGALLNTDIFSLQNYRSALHKYF